MLGDHFTLMRMQKKNSYVTCRIQVAAMIRCGELSSSSHFQEYSNIKPALGFLSYRKSKVSIRDSQ